MCDKENDKTESKYKKRPIESFTDEDYRNMNLAGIILSTEYDKERYKHISPKI